MTNVSEDEDGPLGHLTMLKLPEDEFVTIELVSNPPDGQTDTSSGLSHFVVKVESLGATRNGLASKGINGPARRASGGPKHHGLAQSPLGRRDDVRWRAGSPSTVAEQTALG